MDILLIILPLTGLALAGLLAAAAAQAAKTRDAARAKIRVRAR